MSFQPAARVAPFGTTIFSAMSRLAAEHGAVNLGQGFPDFDGPDPVKTAALDAIRAGQNQYAVGIGQPALRQAVAAHAHRFYGQTVDPETEVTITSGATETLFAAAQALVNPGDEVILIEPYYDAYLPDVLMAGGRPRLVPLRPPAWTFDPDELAAAFNARTRLIVLNTPHNPTGRVFSEAELNVIADLCQRWGVLAVCDEVYEHLVYDDARHLRLATWPGMAERTLSISSVGKTFSFTGWKIGWGIAPPPITAALRAAHQWITFATATPLQAAATAALGLDDGFYAALAREFQARRDFLAQVLTEVGFQVSVPRGAYFILADFSALGFAGEDVAFCRWLTTEIGVAAIPPTAFFSEAHQPLARHWARFAFCKQLATLERAAERLRRLAK